MDHSQEILRVGMLSAIVESSDDAIISKNLDGMITSWNTSAERMFEYTAAEVTGRHISIIIPKELLPEEEVIIRSIKEGKKVDHFRTTRIAKSGRRIEISITVSPVKDSQGNIIGASKIARDISEEVRNQKLIAENTRQLEILNSVSVAISGVLDEGVILQSVVDATTSIAHASAGAFFYDTVNTDGALQLLLRLSGEDKEMLMQFVQAQRLQSSLYNTVGQQGAQWDDVKTAPWYIKEEGNGTGMVVSFLYCPLKNVRGNVVGNLFFCHPAPGVFSVEQEEMVRNIVSQAAVALDNCRLFNELSKLSNRKDEFIALASHELKTPLTTISGYLQVLQERVSEDMSRSFLDKSLRQVQKLNTLVSDMFDASKVEAGRLLLNQELFNLRDLLTDILDVYKYSCKTHAVIFDVSGNDFIVEADKQRIEQVMENLVGNAIKYSPRARQVFVNLQQTGEALLVTVKDEGIGLDPLAQKNIFHRFYRVEGNNNIAGLGLGLYISNEIIKRHGSELKVISEKNKGSAFSFTLPLKTSYEQ